MARSPDAAVAATILQRHHFSSNLKRMSALLRVADSKHAGGPRYEAVMKGAPEVIKKFLGEHERACAKGAGMLCGCASCMAC